MKIEHKDRLIKAGVILVTVLAGTGAYTGYTAHQKMDRAVQAPCPICQKAEFNLTCNLPPIKGELMFPEKRR